MTQILIKSSDSAKEKIVNNILSQALERERKILISAIEKTKLHLAEFEQKYSDSSSQFYDRYLKGLAGDSDDIIDWAGEYQIYLKLIDKLSSLEDIVFANK